MNTLHGVDIFKKKNGCWILQFYFSTYINIIYAKYAYMLFSEHLGDHKLFFYNCAWKSQQKLKFPCATCCMKLLGTVSDLPALSVNRQGRRPITGPAQVQKDWMDSGQELSALHAQLVLGRSISLAFMMASWQDFSSSSNIYPYFSHFYIK